MGVLCTQASNSGKQHYLRAVFSKAGCYTLAVSVVDPVTAEAVQIPAHSASERLVILPGALAAERTQISDLPSFLTAGALRCAALFQEFLLCPHIFMRVPLETESLKIVLSREFVLNVRVVLLFCPKGLIILILHVRSR